MSKFIKPLSKLLLLTMLSTFPGHKLMEIKAEKFFKSFPTKIPGASRINKCYTPFSKYVIIHVKQIHFDGKESQEKLNNLDNIQKNIYKILDSLVEKKFIDSVRIEGFCKMGDNNLEEEIEEEYNEIKKKVNKNNIAKYEYVGGGAEKLVIEGKIKPKPGDTFYGLGRASFYLTVMDRKMHIKHVYDNREDDIIKLIAEDNDVVSLVVYGGKHSLGGKKSCGNNCELKYIVSNKDNIHEWNKKNPDKKLSLIEIIPNEYDKSIIRYFKRKNN